MSAPDKIWPDRLMIRDTGLHDDMGGGGQRIYTTAGRGYERKEYVRADLAEAARDQALLALASEAQKRGEAEGRLAASEMPGMVDLWKRRAAAAEAKLKEAGGVLNALLKEASITSKRGAVTGSHWTHLGMAILKARAFLASREKDK